MPVLKHYKAISLIEKRIAQLNGEISVAKGVMEEAEMHAEYYYAQKDVENFEQDIKKLRNTLNILIKPENNN